jgi:hypothetical protein
MPVAFKMTTLSGLLVILQTLARFPLATRKHFPTYPANFGAKTTSLSLVPPVSGNTPTRALTRATRISSTAIRLVSSGEIYSLMRPVEIVTYTHICLAWPGAHEFICLHHQAVGMVGIANVDRIVNKFSYEFLNLRVCLTLIL